MSDKKVIDIALCKSCVKDCDFKPSHFAEDLRREIQAREPDFKFRVKCESCLKICPRAKIALSTSGSRSVARTPDVDGVMHEVLSLVRRKYAQV